MNISNLPYQAAIPVFKNDGERWTIGWNVFQEGIKIYYQSFFKLGDAPAKRRLKNAGFTGVSPAVELTATGTQVVTAKVPEYPWLTCSVMPILAKFELAIIDGQIISTAATLTPLIAKTSTFTNETTEPQTYDATISGRYTVSEKTIVRDKHTFEAGIGLEWEGKVNWLVAESKFTVKLSFKYGYEHETTAESSQEESYEISDKVTVKVLPGEVIHVSIILYGDVNASATVRLDYRLSGMINGERSNGAYLSQLVSSRSGGTVLSQGIDYVIYRLTAPLQAVLVADSKIVTTKGKGADDIDTILAQAAG